MNRVNSRNDCHDDSTINIVYCQYGLECYSLLKTDLHFLDFVIIRFLMKLPKTANTDII